MIGLEVSVTGKLAVNWIINPKVPLHKEPNIGFDLSYLRFFIAKFVHLKLIFFTSYLFLFFIYPRMNSPYIHANIIDISGFQNELNHPFSSTGFYFKGKMVEGSHDM